MSNITQVQKTKIGQFLTTIPRALAQAKGLNAKDKLRWKIEGNKVVISFISQEAQDE